MKKKIFLLLGHPDSESTGAEFLSSYEQGAKDGGFEVRRTNLGDIHFDPILHKGYKTIQALEPDLLRMQEDIKWADHFVIIYPNWWITMPALLKGLFDRMWLPGFAFHFHTNNMMWDKLMKGKTARVFVTMDANPILERFMVGDFTNEIKRGILGFAGFKVHLKKIGPMKKLNVHPARKEKWKLMFYSMGKKGR